MGLYLKPLEGATVALAEGGQDCLNQVATKRPDLILMDCQMPVMDGFETVIRLRDNGFSGVILALTANSDEETLKRCSQVGMNGHMGKPVDPVRLREAILQALQPAAETPELAPVTETQKLSPSTEAPELAPVAKAPERSPDEPVEDPLARARAIAQATHNPAMLGRLVSAFVKSTEENLGQLRSASQSGDSAAVSALAHKIRGSAGTFGATTFSRTAGLLEDRMQTQTLDDCQGLVQSLLELWTSLRAQLEPPGGSP